MLSYGPSFASVVPVCSQSKDKTSELLVEVCTLLIVFCLIFQDLVVYSMTILDLSLPL